MGDTIEGQQLRCEPSLLRGGESPPHCCALSLEHLSPGWSARGTGSFRLGLEAVTIYLK